MTRKSNNIAKTIVKCIALLQPPTERTVTEWADEFRHLSSESSASPGKYYSSRTPYAREPMDMLSSRCDVFHVVLDWSAQVGKTEIGNNAVGYYMHQDPCPILVVQSTERMAKTWSSDRLTPMIRDTKALAEICDVTRTRMRENSALYKSFRGGHVTVVGTRSPDNLAMRPIRFLFLDEVDRYLRSIKDNGSPKKQAIKRTETFTWNKKILEVSSPTIKGKSEIEKSYQEGSQARYNVPCPHCGEYQDLTWAGIEFEGDENNEPDPETTVYICQHNGCVIHDREKQGMLAAGKWVHKYPHRKKKSYHLNALYSPFISWADVVQEFKECYKFPDLLQTFINLYLAECYEDELEGEEMEALGIANRAEEYKAQVPKGVYFLTAAADVQKDRVEVEILGWGEEEENWSIEYHVIEGSLDSQSVRDALDDILFASYQHELGISLGIEIACIDSGHFTDSVYKYCKQKKMEKRRVYATKGSSTYGQPVYARKTKEKTHNISLYFVGTDTGKEKIYLRLKKNHTGAGALHFPITYPIEYFEQLCSEKKVTKRKNGRLVTFFDKPDHVRNEVLDIKVLNYCAYDIANPKMDMVKKRFFQRLLHAKTTTAKKNQDNKRQVRRSKTGFVHSYKDV